MQNQKKKMTKWAMILIIQRDNLHMEEIQTLKAPQVNPVNHPNPDSPGPPFHHNLQHKF